MANLLSQSNIDIVSSETLLVAQSPEVKHIMSVLEYVHEPSNVEAKLEVINYISSHVDVGDPHLFRLKCIPLNRTAFFQALQPLGLNFSPITALQLSIYESVEYIISSFPIGKNLECLHSVFLRFCVRIYSKTNIEYPSIYRPLQSKKRQFECCDSERHQCRSNYDGS